MSIKLKPGKWVQRDGGIATVVAVDGSKASHHQAIGWRSDGIGVGWRIDGQYCHSGVETKLDLISEYREPREFWIVGGNVSHDLQMAQEHARRTGVEIIHVREVLK